MGTIRRNVSTMDDMQRLLSGTYELKVKVLFNDLIASLKAALP